MGRSFTQRRAYSRSMTDRSARPSDGSAPKLPRSLSRGTSPSRSRLWMARLGDLISAEGLLGRKLLTLRRRPAGAVGARGQPMTETTASRLQRLTGEPASIKRVALRFGDL